jgi:Zinc-finger of C2H2 type/Zinc finger, C2H2 type
MALVLKDNAQLFKTRAGLQEHDRDVHVYCTDCQRSFQNQNNLRHHLSSNLHQPNTVVCPGSGCNKSFISPAGLALHFESGACPSGMTRNQLNRLVVRADRNNVITNPTRLLGGPGGYDPPPSATVWATGRSWNGTAFECFLCNATFRTLANLNQHLQSPRHESKIYRCPKSDCHIEFVTLSGLCQHVEGGSCGVRMFRQVRNVMDSLTRGFNAITI